MLTAYRFCKCNNKSFARQKFVDYLESFRISKLFEYIVIQVFVVKLHIGWILNYAYWEIKRYYYPIIY